MFWVGLVKNGCSHSGHKTLKLAISWKSIDETNWIFAYWYKFREAESYFNNSRVGMVRNLCGYSGHNVMKFSRMD